MQQKQKEQEYVQGDLEIHSKIKCNKSIEEKTAVSSFLKKNTNSIDQQQLSYNELKEMLKKYKEKYQKEAKEKIALQKKLDQYELKLKKLIEIKYKKSLFCKKCFMEEKQKEKHEILEEFNSFSSIVENKLKKLQEASKIKLIQKIPKRNINFIQNFAVFGVPQSTIQSNQINIQNDELEGKVVSSINQPTLIEDQAATFVFPSGMTIKKIFGDKIVKKVTEVMTKNCSKQNSFLLRFQSEQGRFKQVNTKTKQILEILNPAKKLYCLCVGTYDFTFMNRQDKFGASSTSNLETVGTSQPMVDFRETLSQVIKKTEVSSLNKKNQIAITQRVYCIMSYFPFFNLFEDIILSFLTIVKVQRLQIYKHRIEELKQIDSRFQIQRMKQLFNQYLSKFNKQNLQPNSIYQLKLLNQTHTLVTKKQHMQFYHIENWIYQIISIFTLQTFLQTLTLVLLEDKVIFVCENSHILTYTTYLFVNLLCRPFIYTFPSVFILPGEQYLNAPFPVVSGFLKKKQWVQQNRIKQRFKNTYIFLSANGVEIVRTQKQKNYKLPEKLRPELTQIFRNLEKSKKINKKSSIKYDKQSVEYIYHSTQIEKENCDKILDVVKKYLYEQFYLVIPSIEKINQIKNMIKKENISNTKDFHSYLIDKIIAMITEQHRIQYKNEYKNNKQITFFEQFMQTQMINVYISNMTNDQ